MSRFLLPITRNWIGEEFYGTKYALSVAAPHAVSPFLYAKCLLFASSASPKFPRAAAYCNGFLQALRSGAVDSDLVQYVEHFDRSALGKSPGLRKKDENELKVIRTLTPMQHRTMIYDAVKAAMYLNGSAAPNALKQVATGRQRLMERMIQVSATADSVYAQKHQQLVHHRQQHELGTSTAGGVVHQGNNGGAPSNSKSNNGVVSNGQSNNNGSSNNNKPLSPTELELLAYQQQITNKGESKAHDLISASAPSASKDVLIHKNGKFYVPLDRLQEITQQQLLHEHHHYQKMHSMMGDQMSRYHQSLSSVVASTAGSTSATANSSSAASNSSAYSNSASSSDNNSYSSPSSSTSSQSNNSNNGGGNGSSSKNSFVTSSSTISSALSASLRAKGGNRSAYVSGNLREAPRKKNIVVNSVHHHHSSPTSDDGNNNNNNNMNSKTNTPVQQQQQLQQQQQNSSSETESSSSIATSNSTSTSTVTSTSSSPTSLSSSEVAPPPSYDQSLECLREVFDEKQLCDLDTLGKELGLSPDVLIKACEIALRERDVTSRKARLFEDLV